MGNVVAPDAPIAIDAISIPPAHDGFWIVSVVAAASEDTVADVVVLYSINGRDGAASTGVASCEPALSNTAAPSRIAVPCSEQCCATQVWPPGQSASETHGEPAGVSAW